MNNKKVVIGLVPNYNNLNNTLLHTIYGVPNNNSTNILINTDLNDAVHRLLRIDNTAVHTVLNKVTTQVMVYSNKLSNTYHIGHHSTSLQTFTKDTVVLAQNYNYNATHYMYVPYYYVRPHMFDRAHGEPLLTTNRELKYRTPTNLNHNYIRYSKKLPEVKIVVRCNLCNTKMYTSHSKCNCVKPMVVTYNAVAKNGLNTQKPIKYPKVNIPVTTTDIKEFYRYYTRNNKSLNNKAQYSYHKLVQYHKQSKAIKQVVSVYTDHDKYSLLISNGSDNSKYIDIKLLYVNFRVPIDATLSEPSHL